MTYDAFKRNFIKDEDSPTEPTGFQHHEYRRPTLVEQLGASSFNRGLYRVVHTSEVAEWNGRIAVAFPQFSSRAQCFGFDWLGRVFATDSLYTVSGAPGVVMFEPGTGQALEIPCDIVSFHNIELVQHKDAALASGFFSDWIASGGAAPGYGQCIGYKRPLFLGGADEIDNLELSDVDLYWGIVGQIIARTGLSG